MDGIQDMRYHHPKYPFRHMMRCWGLTIASGSIVALAWSVGGIVLTGSIFIPDDTGRTAIHVLTQDSTAKQYVFSFLYIFAFSLTLCMICSIGIFAWRLPGTLVRLYNSNRHLCLCCRYDTDHVKSDACPECGYPIDRMQQEAQWFQYYGVLLWVTKKVQAARDRRGE